MNRYLAGAIGGLLATVPMTLAMEALYRRLPREERYPLPPREITQNLLQKVQADARLNEEQLVELSLVSHFGYGTLAGALYPAITQKLRILWPTAAATAWRYGQRAISAGFQRCISSRRPTVTRPIAAD